MASKSLKRELALLFICISRDVGPQQSDFDGSVVESNRDSYMDQSHYGKKPSKHVNFPKPNSFSSQKRSGFCVSRIYFSFLFLLFVCNMKQWK